MPLARGIFFMYKVDVVLLSCFDTLKTVCLSASICTNRFLKCHKIQFEPYK